MSKRKHNIFTAPQSISLYLQDFNQNVSSRSCTMVLSTTSVSILIGQLTGAERHMNTMHQILLNVLVSKKETDKLLLVFLVKIS